MSKKDDLKAADRQVSETMKATKESEKAVKEAISREEADDLKGRLTDVGASVEIK